MLKIVFVQQFPCFTIRRNRRAFRFRGWFGFPGSDWFRYRVGVVELNIAPAFGLFRLKLDFELFRRVFLLC